MIMLNINFKKVVKMIYDDLKAELVAASYNVL